MSGGVKFKDLIIKEKLEPPSSFLFPFTPYEIQHNFMTTLYSTLEDKKIGIFESPTGTGKTLSIICGAMHWLLDHEQREYRQLKTTLESLSNRNEESDDDDNWIIEQAKMAEQQRKVHELNLMVKSLEEFNSNIERIKKEQVFKKSKIKLSENNVLNQKNNIKIDQTNDKYFLDEETEFLLEEYEQSSCTDDLEVTIDEKLNYNSVQIYFCSRTHSQLSQFMAEIKKSPYSTARVIPLASRQIYCINKTVKNLNNITLINERCLEMGNSKQSQKPTKVSSIGSVVKKKKSETICKCVYNDKEKIQSLAEEVTTEIKDIEELIDRAEQLSTCPYYASRKSINYSQIVVLPYNTLLHKKTREASGVRLEGNIFIIDEAHNLLDTISHIHSSQINGQQLTYSYSQLLQYKEKFKFRFNASNLLHLNQLIYVIEHLIIILGGTPGLGHSEASKKEINSKVYTLDDFVHEAKIDHLNMFILVDFLEKSKICQKIRGYSEKYKPSIIIKPEINNLQALLKSIETKNNKGKTLKEDENKQQNTDVISNNPLAPVSMFINSLTNHSEDGRIVCTTQSIVGKGVLKFLLLNPAVHFKEIIEKARSVIVSGGTMEPISEFKDQIFNLNGSSLDRIVHFSCGHVVPSDHILPLIMCSGPTGQEFDFSYQERTSAKMLNEIGSLLENVCRTVPAGIVCFFPSYDYEQYVYQHLEQNKVISRLSERKKVFREPKLSNQVDEVLKNYSQTISTLSSSNSKLTGALLFSVIGGKLSEGLNFSDDLGRCVIVIGLPYPNIKSAELQEKMQYLNNYMGPGSGQKHYENLCMKAVNQSIGRSVRHKQDYASVLLLDKRYQRDNVRNSLPKWLQPSLQIHTKFGTAFSQLHKFFGSKKKKN